MCLQLQRPPEFDALNGRIKVLGCIPHHLQIEEECESSSYLTRLVPALGGSRGDVNGWPFRLMTQSDPLLIYAIESRYKSLG